MLEATPAIDIDGDGIFDIEADSDGDSIPDNMEEMLGTAKYNPDSDGDGTADNIEIGDNLSTPRDSNGDGKIDALDESIRGGISTLVNYTVFGKLLNKLGEPLENVTVQVADKVVVTNAKGYWEISDLKEGNYKVTARKDGYLFTPENFNLEGENSRIEINMNVIEPTFASCQFYAVHDQGLSDSQFFTIHSDNYQINKLGPLHQSYDIEAIAIHPETNQIYAASGQDVGEGQLKGQLYLVDGQTGELFSIGQTDFNEIEDLAFDSEGTLWAWAKGDGLLTIDLTTGAGTPVIPSQIQLEGLTVSKNTEHTVFYGSVGHELWRYELAADQLEIVCTNLPGETEALEMVSENQLLMGIHQDKNFSLQGFDVTTCQLMPNLNMPTHPFNDVEGIALPIEACQK